MTMPPVCTIGSELAARLRAERETLVRRWLDRITARVALTPNRVFPTDELLNHVPLLIDGIASFLENTGDELDADMPVVAKARELGALRHEQGFSAHEILKEHEILGAIMLAFIEEVVDDLDAPCPPRELASCLRRVTQAVEQIRQATANHFLQLWAERVQEREDRLRRFNRMVSHELKNRVSAIRGAGSLLGEDWITASQRRQFQRIVSENAQGLQHLLENLEALSRLESDSRQQRNVLLPQAAAEAVRQLRDQAQRRGVEVRISRDLPAVEVNAAAVELCLANFVSNAIKYSDPAKTERWVTITGAFHPRRADGRGGELVIRVCDNGIGVPAAARERLFQQFYRAHEETVTGVEGTGLGLSIVRETAESLGGRVWAEFPEDGGAAFAIALPSRREEDAAAAGVTRAT